ncbi:MAG: SRPBCC family protein [Elusimicrobia bacterium]|nr:SRPBCC family protein [Elusimicrobiota bacterium]
MRRGTRSPAWRAALLLPGLLAPGAAEAGRVTVDCRRAADGRYEISGSFEVAASSRAVWAVLTDYDRIRSFVPDMRKSRVRRRLKDGVLLEQEAAGRFFLFTRSVRVLLDVRERPFETLEFRDTLLEDFEHYEGSWTLTDGAEALTVAYRLSVEPALNAPQALTRAALRSNARALLDRIRAEILRRGG